MMVFILCINKMRLVFWVSALFIYTYLVCVVNDETFECPAAQLVKILGLVVGTSVRLLPGRRAARSSFISLQESQNLFLEKKRKNLISLIFLLFYFLKTGNVTH